MITNQTQQPIPANLSIDGIQASSDWHERNSDIAAAGWRLLVREAGDAPFGYLDAVPQDQDGTPIWYTALAGTPEERDAAVAAQAASQAEQEAIQTATDRADDMARVAAVDAAIDDMPDEDVAVLTYIYPAWSGDSVGVTVDEKLRHGGILYRVVQAHTTQADWPPDVTPALFTRYREPSAAPEPWVQPTGAQDAYQTGDRVTHNGQTWVSTIDANVWAPGVTGWDVV